VKWSFFTNPGVSTADSNAMLLEAISTFDTLTSLLSADGWSFAKVPFNDSSTTLTLIADDNFCSGTGQVNIDGYVCHIRQLFPPLSESLPGTYKVNFRSSVHVDVNDIKAKGANSTEDANLLHHAVMHGVLAHIGIGMNTIQGNNCSKRSISTGAFCNAMRPGELCRAKSYVADGSGTFALASSTCVD
jgi:hypothetical protein